VPAELRVGPSHIAGAGVFAAAPLGSGTAVNADHGFNHSCDPNLWWTADGTLVTRRAVAAGEELTFDYASADTDPGFLLRCHCETYRCRQMVTGDDWQIAELQRLYEGHWSPAVQRLIGALR
jgi:hypothetical protein